MRHLIVKPVRVLLPLVVVAALCVGSSALAQGGIALQFSGGTPESPLLDNGTWGWSFTVNSPITVTYLGFYAAPAGLVNSHAVGIWVNGGALVVSGVVAPGSGGGWHWTPVTNTYLAPGNYVIGAYYNPDDPDVGYSNATTVSTLPEVSYGQNRYYAGSGFNRPDDTWSGYGLGVFGPNFQYVPEPALLQLPFLVGLGGVGFWWRRRQI